jgi:hypothetical protein
MGIATTLFLLVALGSASTRRTARGSIAMPELPQAKIERIGGVPTVVINGRPSSMMTYMTYNPTPKYFRQVAEAGIRLYSFSAVCSGSAYSLAPPVEIAPGQYDYSQLDERLAMVVEADPQAYIFPRVYLMSPPWWDEQNPDELVLQQTEDGSLQPLFETGPEKRVPSWASDKWREHTAEALRAMVRHIEAGPFASHVIGYHLASGVTEEWMMWGGNDGLWADYSKPNQEKFRAWLRRKYGSDVARLRKAWAREGVDFDTAAIPSRAEREATSFLGLRDPRQEQAVIDFYNYNSDLVAATIAYFARVVKDETRGRALVGAFYGYVMQLSGSGDKRLQNAGHLALTEAWDCPEVDFFTSPSHYSFRELDPGYSTFMSLTDSIKLHGKVWFDENDYRTFLTPGPLPQWGKRETFEESAALQDRELGNVLSQGCGMWWFDMGGGWYDDPRMLEVIARLNKVGEEVVGLDRSGVDEIAVLVDPRSLCAVAPGYALMGPLFIEQLQELGHLGTPFGLYHLDDLPRLERVRRTARLLIFLNVVAPTAKQREMIHRYLSGGGKTAVWIWAPGLVTEAGIDEKAMEELTGIRLNAAKRQGELVVSVGGRAYGTRQRGGPVCWAADEDAEVLGTLESNGRPGLVRKRVDGHTAIYSSAPCLPSWLLRDLARAAGVHLYLDEDAIVYANRSLLSVTAIRPGPHLIHLPAPRAVQDLYVGISVGTNLSEFPYTLSATQTALFLLR